MAQAFPKSDFVGYDISRYALDRAEARRVELGVANVRFVDPRDEGLPTDHRVDFITTFDCIHDMAKPTEMMESIRAAIAEDGTWLLVDIKARETYGENVEQNPMSALLYGLSVLTCMSSALSEAGGEGLGTLGLPASKAEAMSVDAGFTRFEQLGVRHSLNAFYAIRP